MKSQYEDDPQVYDPNTGQWISASRGVTQEGKNTWKDYAALGAIGLGPLAYQGLTSGAGASGGAGAAGASGGAAGTAAAPASFASIAGPAGGFGGAAGGGAAAGGLTTGLSWSSFLKNVGPQLVSSALQSIGTRQAQNALTKAGNQALDLQRQQTAVAQQKIDQAQQIQGQLYGRSLSNLSPYTSLGAGAAGLLGQGLGIPPGPAGGPPLPSSGVSVPPLGQSGLSPVKPGNAQGVVLNPMGPTLTPGGLRDAGGEAVSSAVSRGSSYGGGSNSNVVVMESPDGKERMPVPREQVQMLQARGARVVG